MRKGIAIFILICGIALCCAGIFTKIPNDKLTTYSFLEKEYSVIEEYVGGDAYNYIIGASIVGGKIAGATAQRAIFISSGVILICAGVILLSISKNEGSPKDPDNIEEAEVQ